MDEAFQIHLSPTRIHSVAVQGELDDVVGCDASGRHVASQQEHAGMAECIHDALIEQDVVGDNNFFDQDR
jgi:hypothetical protein